MTDQWTSRDLPVLIATVELLDEAAGRPVDEKKIVAATGMDRDDVVRALVNLERRHLDVNLNKAMGGQVVLAIVRGVTAAGLEASGTWPTPEDAVDRFLAALDRVIDETPSNTPKAGRLLAIRDGAKSMSRDVLVEVMGAVLTGRIPM